MREPWTYMLDPRYAVALTPDGWDVIGRVAGARQVFAKRAPRKGLRGGRYWSRDGGWAAGTGSEGAGHGRQ